MKDEPAGPSAALSPLARARLDELLHELLQRVDDVLDAQERLRGLLDAVVAIAADLSLHHVLQQITTVAARLVDAEYAALGVLSSGAQRGLRDFVTHGMSDEQRAVIGDLPRGRGILGHIIDIPEPLRLSDLREHPDSFGLPAGHPPMTTFLGVPIRIRDKVFGNLYLTEKRGGAEFTPEDEEIVVALAAAAGVVIENARLYEEAARREAWLSAAAEITAALLAPVGRDEALQLVADRARSVASADLAVVMLQGLDDELVIHVVSGAPEAGARGRRFPAHGSLAGAALTSGDMLVVEDMATEQGSSLGFEQPEVWPELGPVMLLPLRTSNGVVGVLVLAWARQSAHVFYDVDVHLPAAFAEQAALALQVVSSQEDRALLAVFEDRDRIGRDLHDLVIQRLFAIGLSLENASRLVERPEVSGRIGVAVDDIDATIKDIRRSIFALSAPAESTDLRSELHQALANAAPGLGFQPRLETSGPVDLGVPPAIRPHLVAVMTEALSNVVRHAEPTSVNVALAVEDQVVFTVSDDGKGFDPLTEGRLSGLRHMRERAESLGGTCEVDSAPGRGTRFVWRVPVRSPVGPPPGAADPGRADTS